MKKEKWLDMLRLLLTPGLMVLLGLVLVLRPDFASAFVGKTAGWLLLALGGGVILGSVVLGEARLGRVIFALAALSAGLWLLRNPLALAAAMGRIAGLLILIRALQDILNAARWQCSSRYAVAAAVVGGVLLLLPMTTSRIVMVVLGLIVLALGVIIALDRLNAGKRSFGDDSIIDV